MIRKSDEKGSVWKIFHWIIAGKHDILTDSAVISHSEKQYL